MKYKIREYVYIMLKCTAKDYMGIDIDEKLIPKTDNIEAAIDESFKESFSLPYSGNGTYVIKDTENIIPYMSINQFEDGRWGVTTGFEACTIDSCRIIRSVYEFVIVGSRIEAYENGCKSFDKMLKEEAEAIKKTNK